MRSGLILFTLLLLVVAQFLVIRALEPSGVVSRSASGLTEIDDATGGEDGATRLERQAMFAPDLPGVLLAGFRGLVVDLLFLKAQSDLRRGDKWVLPEDYRLIVSLMPHNVEIWDFLAYQLSFNLADEDLESRRVWHREGLRFLDEGLAENPDSPLLHHLKGRILSRRLFDPAFAWLKDEHLRLEGESDLARAAHHFRRASELLPDEPSYSLAWASVEIDLGEERAMSGDLDQACKAFVRARAAVGRSIARGEEGGLGFRVAWPRINLALDAVVQSRKALAGKGGFDGTEIDGAVKLLNDFKAIDPESEAAWVDELLRRLLARRSRNPAGVDE